MVTDWVIAGWAVSAIDFDGWMTIASVAVIRIVVVSVAIGSAVIECMVTDSVVGTSADLGNVVTSSEIGSRVVVAVVPTTGTDVVGSVVNTGTTGDCVDTCSVDSGCVITRSLVFGCAVCC